MESVRVYMISLVATCMIGVIATALVKNERMQRMVRFLSGLLVAVTALTPLLNLDMEELAERIVSSEGTYSLDTDDLRADTHTLLCRHIKQTAQTYIESKAEELGAVVRAEVTLDDGEYPVPVAAEITGTLSAAQLTGLSQYMTEALGIPPEAQKWRQYETGG